MKHLIVLFGLCIFLSSCTAKKIKQSQSIKTIASLIEPKGHHHSHPTETPSEHHYSTFSFLADSAGQKVHIVADYDAGINNFFYHHAKAGDMFEVVYQIGHPHKFIPYSNKPRLDPQYIDTTLGKIINIHPTDGVIEFEYSPKDKEHKKLNVLKKMQDIRDSTLKEFPAIKNETYYEVIYSTLDSTKAIMLVNEDKEEKLKHTKEIKKKKNGLWKKNNEEDYVILEGGAFCTSMDSKSKNIFGAYLPSFQYQYAERFWSGLDWGIALGKINDKFSYPFAQPELGYIYFGWINSYEFLRSNRIKMNVNLRNGLAFFELADAAQSSTSTSVSPENTYYLLEPGLSVFIKLGKYFGLNLKSGYRFLYGKTEFGTKNQFENYSFGICLTFRIGD